MVHLYKVTDGAATQLTSAQGSLAVGTQKLELEATGSTLTAYLNGQFLFSFTDTSATAYQSGTAGIVSIGDGSSTFGPAFSSLSIKGI
jgi:hypothetical protein